MSGSPGINAGNTNDSFDQRNVLRPQGGAKDIGAFELVNAADLPGGFEYQVSGENLTYNASFTRFSNRGPNFALLRQDATGAISSLNSPGINSYIGSIKELPGAIASATIIDNSVFYHVLFEDGKEWVNEGAGTRVLCERNAAQNCKPFASRSWPEFLMGSGGAGSNMYGAEVAVDIPSNRFSGTYRHSTNRAMAMIEYSIMSINLIYMRDAGIQHRLGRVILRDGPARDPYAPLLRSATVPACARSTLPQHCAFRLELENQWENVLPGVLSTSNHDLGVVIVGENSAGLASIGTVGEPTGYSANDSTTEGDFSNFLRHEIGHNWSLGHYDGGAPEGPTINSDNQLSRMSGPEQKLVTSFRDMKRSFLDLLGPLITPLPPKAATDRAWAAPGASVVIDVLDNDHDANGDVLSLVSVDAAPSTDFNLGGRMQIAPGQGAGGRDAIRYQAPGVASSLAFERFSYRIRDASGLESIGYVFVRSTFLPVATFAATPGSGTAPLTVALNASEASDPDGTIAAYDWSSSTGQTASGVAAAMAFESAGTHTITLTVTDNTGATAKTTRTVLVSAAPTTSPSDPALTSRGVLADARGNNAVTAANFTIQARVGTQSGNQLTAGQRDVLELNMVIDADPADVGQIAEIVVAVIHEPPNGPLNVYSRAGPSDWVWWNGVRDLEVSSRQVLAERQTISILAGPLPLPGKFSFYVGYRVGAKLVYNGLAPLVLTVR